MLSVSNLTKTSYPNTVVPGSLNNIFSADTASFNERCLEMFRFQFENNKVYGQWCTAIGRDFSNVQNVTEIPFLPISFFKTDKVVTTAFEPAIVFESSGTTGMDASRHYVKDVQVYRRSFFSAFERFYGDPKDYCILALLPSYLERGGSSLVYMVGELIKRSGHEAGGFYLDDHAQLASRLSALEQQGQKTMLFGVTYALLDFAQAHAMPLQNTIIIETGGMKGRKKEMTRDEVHSILKSQFGLASIHSEYSMTELMSQAYSTGEGTFVCPPWMKIYVRSEDDPFEVRSAGRGVINIVDLANIYSCAFIATDDAGLVYDNGLFEVLGRVDNSDIRGCSLLAV